MGSKHTAHVPCAPWALASGSWALSPWAWQTTLKLHSAWNNVRHVNIQCLRRTNIQCLRRTNSWLLKTCTTNKNNQTRNMHAIFMQNLCLIKRKTTYVLEGLSDQTSKNNMRTILGSMCRGPYRSKGLMKCHWQEWPAYWDPRNPILFLPSLVHKTRNLPVQRSIHIILLEHFNAVKRGNSAGEPRWHLERERHKRTKIQKKITDLSS